MANVQTAQETIPVPRTADPDAELIREMQSGSAEAFDALVLKYRASMLNFLYRMVHDYNAAEDLAQDVFLRVYRSRMGYQPRAKFTTWLFRIATNVALNHRRDRRHVQKQISVDDMVAEGTLVRELKDRRVSSEQMLIQRARQEQVRAAIRRLPAKQRTAVLLHKYQELEYVDIAAVLKTTVPAIKSLLFRAYGTLRSALDETCV